MIPLVAVSGSECVEALAMEGFALQARTPSGVTLSKGKGKGKGKGESEVFVPDVSVLPPEELMAILESAGVSYSHFLDLLSEAPTDPAISRTRPAAGDR